MYYLLGFVNEQLSDYGFMQDESTFNNKLLILEE